MPELPEVETARRRVHRLLHRRRIEGVSVRSDPIVFDGTPPRRIAAALRGATVLGTGRKGKHFWLELDRRPWPIFHFGMSGSVQSYRGERERPPYLKLEILAGGGRRIGWTDARRLGRIRLRWNPIAEPPISRLGFDALEELPDVVRFHRELAIRRAPIKAVLLDQEFSAGVGNWIADEVLFQAGIAPHRRACDLSPAGARKLRDALHRVVGLAVRLRGDDSRFPRDWLFHRRWGRGRDAESGRGPRLTFSTIGGRTTAWAPSRQR